MRTDRRAPAVTTPLPEVTDLHAGLLELSPRLVAAAERGQWLDAFLYAAGMLQIAEDRLQGTARPARRLVDHLGGRSAGPEPSAVLRAAQAGVEGTARLRLAAPAARTADAWTRRLARLVDRLADLVVDPDGVTPAQAAGLLGELRSAARTDGVARLLGTEVLRPPACFRSFDQHPQDVVELVRRFAAVHPSPGLPLLVVGVRTSGSYLGPLAGAALRRLGYRTVVTGTTRPGSELLPGRGSAVRGVLRGRGVVLVVDDPPASGGSLAAVAARAERAGFPPDAVHPLFAVFGDAADAPQALRRHPCTVLPGTDWEVRALLRPPSLAQALARLLGPDRRLVALEADRAGLPSRWSHLSVPLTARIREDGRERTLALTAEAAGIGYFGQHSVDLARLLTGLVPDVLGFADGVLLRERLPGEAGAGPGGPVDAAEVVRYVAARQRLLAVPADRSLRLAGREPAWEVAARMLGPALGRLDLLLRPALLHPLARSLLAADRPCLVDGRTLPALWAADGNGRWRKTEYAEGAFSHLDLASYDAAFDLAGAAVPGGGTAATDPAPDDLRSRYRELTGHEVPAARWCLLRLLQAPRAARLAAGGAPQPPPGARVQARRAQARAVQRFLADAYLADLADEPRGPWCVLDVDGVLETDVLGFPAGSPQGMLALRALRAHGHRVLLATGRSLPEVRDRCEAYRLPGGVGEYGAVCHDAGAGTDRALVRAGDWEEPDRQLRARLAALPAVSVDPLFRWCVRASLRGPGGRGPLPHDTVAALLADPYLGRHFGTVRGDAQTDFVPRGVDKATGVRALLGLLGAGGATPLLAVGDGPADLTLLRWARYGFAPANAGAAVRTAGVPVLRRSYQAGLSAAVAGVVGHRPGGCPRCRPPRHDPQTRALLALLAVPEDGRAGAPARLLRLALAGLALPRPDRSGAPGGAGPLR